VRKRVLLGILIVLTSLPLAFGQSASNDDPSGKLIFAFWYAPWTADTWQKLQPANVFVGVPPNAVADIHQHGGKALRYVTYYQNLIGRDFLKDKADLDNVGFHTPAGYLLSAFKRPDNYVLCPNSVELRKRIAASLDQILGTQGYDGLFVDNAYIAPASQLVCDAKHAHVKAGEKGGPAYIDLMEEVDAIVRKQKPSSVIVMNAGNPALADEVRNGNKTLWDVSDFVVWESFAYTSMAGTKHDNWSNSVAVSDTLTQHAGKVLSLAYPRNVTEAVNSYAFAKIMGYHYAANLGEDQKGMDVEGGHYGIFLNSLPLDLGQPTSSISRQSGLAFRDFEHGQAVANFGTKTVSQRAPRDATLYLGDEKKQIKKNGQFKLPPNQGAILIY
jgi:hypothetical protein